jgi:hypothetical protein
MDSVSIASPGSDPGHEPGGGLLLGPQRLRPARERLDDE